MTAMAAKKRNVNQFPPAAVTNIAAMGGTTVDRAAVDDAAPRVSACRARLEPVQSERHCTLIVLQISSKSTKAELLVIADDQAHKIKELQSQQRILFVITVLLLLLQVL